MESLEPALLWVAAICCALTAIWAFAEKALKPMKDLMSRVEKLEKVAETNHDKLDRDHESFRHQEEINILILKSCSLLMKHCADNNHTGELSRQAAEIDKLVYTKSGSL